jgi:hypothetical protein
MSRDPSESRADLAALADLDAGLPDPAEAARRRAAAAADPSAAAMLDALAATRAELAALPAPEVPPAAAARWKAALEAESAADRHMGPRGAWEGAPDRHMGPRGGSPGLAVRRSRRRRVALAAVVVALAVAGIGVLLHRPDPAPAAVALVELVAVGRATVGTTDVGPLADPARRAACLRAVAPASTSEALLGGRRVVLDGRPGILLVLAAGRGTGLRILTVDPSCGPGGGTLLAEVVVG